MERCDHQILARMWHVDGVLSETAVGPTSEGVLVPLVGIPAKPIKSCISHYSGNHERVRHSNMSG